MGKTRIDTSDGTVFYLETDEKNQDTEISRSFGFSDTKLLTALKPIFPVFISVKELMEKAGPEKINIEFGVSIGVEAGQLAAILMKGNTKANLKISLEWKKG